MSADERPGMKAFRAIWLGQLASIFGTEMTTFALAIWAWEVTGQATALAMILAFTWVPLVIMSPLAGVLVDRWSRKWVLILADTGSACVTLLLLLLYATDSMQVWHLFVAAALNGIFESFQAPAFSASITLLVHKEDYSRSSGMMTLATSLSAVLAPIVAAALLAFVRLDTILLIDLTSFGLAVLTLTLTRIPQPPQDPASLKRFHLWRDVGFGFRYIAQRPSLLGLQMVILSSNFVKTFGVAVLIPMVLARSGGDELLLSSVQSAAALGLVAGGAAVSLWKGTRRQIHGVLLSILLSALFSQLLFGLGQSLVPWVAFAFLGALFRPWTLGAASAIWQSKVEPEAQGRIFATRRVLAQTSIPLAYFLAGPLADRVLEPAMMPGGALAGVFGGLVGTGPGAGMALMIVLAGAASLLVAVAGYLLPAVREVESIVPDYDESEGPRVAATAL